MKKNRIAPATGDRDVPGFRTRPEPNVPEPSPPLVATGAGRAKQRRRRRITTR